MKRNSTAFTIVELLAASSIAVLVIGAAFAIWITIQGSWHTERIKSNLLGNIQIAMENMKQELMLSDGNKTVTAYNGISFPMARDNNPKDGFIELDSSNRIIWDDTVVYHVYNNSGSYELRKTIFTPRNNLLSGAQLQAQLDSVISHGNGVSGKASGESTTTQTVISGFKDLKLEISPIVPSFDEYASNVTRSQNVSFGSILLDPGYHTISFEVIGKNASSAGYGLGIDSFSITPSGCVLEAEDFINLVHLDGSSGIAGSSRDVITKENMTSYGIWSGNYQLNYSSDSINDYVTLKFYYDMWRETNFSQGSLENVVVKFTNEDGAGGNPGDNDYIVMLDGNTNEQTQGTKGSKSINSDDGDSTTYRNIIISSARGRLCSVKFSAGENSSLTIEKAYICKRESGQDGSTASSITFNNCDIDPRNAGQGVAPYNGGVGIIIPENKSGWSNWIDIGANIEAAKEYFVTFYVRDLSSTESMSISYWQGENVRSYKREGDYAEAGIWGTGGVEDNNLYGVDAIAVRYADSGRFTSQIYDTGMDDPEFSSIIWNIKRNNYPDAGLLLRIRSNDSYDTLSNDSDWSDELTINTNSAMTGNADISAIEGGRYVQFQAEFFSYESGENNTHQTNDTDDEYDNDEDYDMSCVLQDVSIMWPGQSRIVDISGYYTLKPNYCKFTVKIDGHSLTKGLEAKLTATEGSYGGRSITSSLNTEIEFRNTNK